MMRIPLPGAGWLLLSCTSLVSTLPAQSTFFVEHNKRAYPVVSVLDSRALVMENGKPVVASSQRGALRDAEEYLPVFVAVRDERAETAALDVEGNQINKSFRYRATFESAQALDDVFLVLEMQSEDAGKVLFWYGIGRLEARRPRPFEVRVPLALPLGEGTYRLHLFAGGREVLHSQLSMPYRERKLDEMVAKRIAGVAQRDLQPFIGAAPEYPAKLRRAGLKGQAVIEALVTIRGAVVNPAVQSSSDPAFGEAALAAVRMWRFLPKVRNGRPLETKVRIPFAFDPPDKH